MDHRHLLPSEFDLIVDGGVGFGLTPLHSHVRHCPQCQAELERARRVVDLLEELPHFAPARDFSDRVMTRVHVFIPWHVTARDTLRQMVPRSRGVRVLAGAAAFAFAFAISAGAMALLVRMDVVLFSLGLGIERGRTVAIAAAASAAETLFGASAVSALAAGGVSTVLLVTALFLATLAGAALVLRRLAVASRTRER